MHMSDRVVELIYHVINDLFLSRVQSGEAYLLTQYLAERGYTAREIAAAMPWLMEHSDYDTESLEIAQPQIHSEKAYRILSEFENLIITPAAYGFLIQLREFGLVSEMDMERVLDRATNAGLTSIGVGEIEAITSALLLDMDRIPPGTFFHYDYSVEGH